MAAQRVRELIPPRDAVGYLAMQWSTGGWAYGSGALINAQYILTCSHNLIDPVTDPAPIGHAQQVLFYPGYNQQRPASPPPNGLPVRVGFFSNRFYNGEDAWDVGVCRLAAPLAAPPPAFFVPTVTGEDIIGQNVTLTGYPGPHQGEMWEDVDQVAGVHLGTNTMIYTNDTWGGNSGSPTWTYNAIADIVCQHAIHVSRGAQELRRGVLITQDIYNWIQAALQAAPPHGPGFHRVGLA
ncbi:MAG: trypsin-like peptidase domain-containing protein [Chloroflexota bacterium]